MCFSCFCNVEQMVTVVPKVWSNVLSSYISSSSMAVSPSQPLNDTAQFLVRSALWEPISWCMADVEQSGRGLATKHHSFERWIMQQIISKNVRGEIHTLWHSDLTVLQCVCLDMISLQIAWQPNAIVPGDQGLRYKECVNENLFWSGSERITWWGISLPWLCDQSAKSPTWDRICVGKLDSTSLLSCCLGILYTPPAVELEFW